MEHLVKDSLSDEEVALIIHSAGTTEDKVLLFKSTVPGVSTKEIADWYTSRVLYTIVSK